MPYNPYLARALMEQHESLKSLAATDEGYDARTVAELKEAIATRNDGREEADQITVEQPGNKPQLIAALEADDAANRDVDLG